MKLKLIPLFLLLFSLPLFNSCKDDDTVKYLSEFIELYNWDMYYSSEDTDREYWGVLIFKDNVCTWTLEDQTVQFHYYIDDKTDVITIVDDMYGGNKQLKSVFKNVLLKSATYNCGNEYDVKWSTKNKTMDWYYKCDEYQEEIHFTVAEH